MRRIHPQLWITVFLLGLAGFAIASEQPQVMTPEDIQAILDKTLDVHLAPDLSTLTTGERAALDDLLGAGGIMQKLYEDQKHAHAETARAVIAAGLAEGSQWRFQYGELYGEQYATNVAKLYRMAKGPVATTLDNRRQQFIAVPDEQLGKNVYPSGVTREEIDAAIAADPSLAAELMAVRSVVRRNSLEQQREDLATLGHIPILGFLHAEFEQSLSQREPDGGFYAVPYAVAYAEELLEASELLRSAAAKLQGDDAEFAAYLRHRALDLLTNNYEAGDASWVTGRFSGNLNAQIGSYETYDDALFGVKAFHSMSLLKRDAERSAEVAKTLGSLQEIEDRLPYDRQKKVRDDIPVGVYQVIADFGQARGTNTATILPNDAGHTRKYGRTILLRSNIMTHPELFGLAQDRYQAAVAPEFHDHLLLDSNFQRTLWHEVGHYLGVDRTADGRDLDVALQDAADLYEEMKSDLVSLFAAGILGSEERHDQDALRGIYASGILRVLQSNQPRREQAYQTMQLMQWNYFLENGALSFDAETGTLTINYQQYPLVVETFLRRVLAIQSAGDLDQAREFDDRYTAWEEALHGVIASKIRDALTHRFRSVTYQAVDGGSQP